MPVGHNLGRCRGRTAAAVPSPRGRGRVAPGETTKTISIEVKGDSKREADETFYLERFGNSSNSLFNWTRGIGTILNDD